MNNVKQKDDKKQRVTNPDQHFNSFTVPKGHRVEQNQLQYEDRTTI